MSLHCGQQDLPNKSLQMWGFLCHRGTGAQLEVTLSVSELLSGLGSQAGLTQSRNLTKRAWQVFWEKPQREMLFWLIQVFEKEEFLPSRVVGNH